MAAVQGKKRIGEVLIQAGLISQAQLQRALNHQATLKAIGERPMLGNVLIELNILTVNQLLAVTQRYDFKMPFCEYLLMDNKVTKDQVYAALAMQEANPTRRLGDILVKDLKVISHETLLRTIARQHNVTRIKPDVSDVEPDVFFAFADKTLLERQFVPYKKFLAEQGVVICQCLVADVKRKDLQKLTDDVVRVLKTQISIDGKGTDKISITVEYALADLDEIMSFIPHAHENKEAISFSKKIKIDIMEREETLNLGRKYYSTNTNLNIFMQIMMKAIDMGASDLHFEPMKDKLRVRFRIDGVLIPQADLPKALNAHFIRGLKNFFRFKDSHLRNVVVDDRKRVFYEDKAIEADLRISILPTVYGDKMVIRILIQSDVIPTFEKLGMFKNLMLKYQMVCSMSSGIVIVTGPTGSGKTTTLFATLDYLNDDAINILTLEDPPEYLIDGVNQARVSADESGREISYINGLKSALRQDPDIIMFGEMRDHESASVALTAGLTGHLLFTTLHTNDAASAITRLFDMGIRPFMLSSTLVSILGQRLIRLTCNQCKEEYTPKATDLDFFRIFIRSFDIDLMAGNVKFYRGKGCEHCMYTGYKGRIAIHELLCVNDEIRRNVLEGGTAREAENIARNYGMTSMIEDGLLKVINGYTTVEEVLRVAKTLENPKITRTIDEIRYLLEGDLTREQIIAAVFSSVGLKDTTV
ncbi:MAG: type II/IV secretion system protein [Nitrospirae bacterium]|nr:type II/IV secretion system protein [Nitrospirota bacterium]MBF0593023.1 type II/IV secretion system protein [Nitrospirota bacterium]